jgi:hypothetical protein
MRMATSLGVETVCEGVEREDQLEFLREIGCSKIQGYYYTKPISVEAIMERYRQGVQIGFENPEETDYFETISSINLYDLSVLANDEDGSFRNFFNTLPMAIIEVRGNYTRFARCNVSYREFMSRAFHIPMADIDNEFHEIPSEGPGSGFVRNIVECCEEGGRAVVDEKLPDGSIVHSLIRLVSTNPVTDTSAIVVAVLAITENGEGTSYANIARTLASDYFNLFYVDLNTEDFVEYSSDIGSEDISFERHGENFFEASANDAKILIYEEDVDRFVKIFTKERVVKAIDEQGSFNINYRLKTDIEPIFVTMKAVRMKGETDHIIIGVRMSIPR